MHKGYRAFRDRHILAVHQVGSILKQQNQVTATCTCMSGILLGFNVCAVRGLT